MFGGCELHSYVELQAKIALIFSIHFDHGKENGTKVKTMCVEQVEFVDDALIASSGLCS